MIMSNIILETEPMNLGKVQSVKFNILNDKSFYRQKAKDAKYKTIQPIIDIILTNRLEQCNSQMALAEAKLLHCYVYNISEYTKDIREHLSQCDENLTTFSILIATRYLDYKSFNSKGSYDQAYALLREISKKITTTNIKGFPKEILLTCKYEIRKMKSKVDTKVS